MKKVLMLILIVLILSAVIVFGEKIKLRVCS